MCKSSESGGVCQDPGLRTQEPLEVPLTVHSKGPGTLKVLVCMFKVRTDTGYIIHIPKTAQVLVLFNKEGKGGDLAPPPDILLSTIFYQQLCSAP